MSVLNRLENSPSLWNNLLQDDAYLRDQNLLVKDRINKAFSWLSGRRILNIGTGQGYFEKSYILKVKNDLYVGIDISTEGLKNLKEIITNRVNASITSLPFKNESFDLLICMEVLEHLPKSSINLVFNEMKRILTEQGKMIISVPIYEPVSLVDHPVGHMRKYTIKEIMAELKDSDIKIISSYEIYAFNRFRFILSLISRIFSFRRPSVVILLCQKY